MDERWLRYSLLENVIMEVSCEVVKMRGVRLKGCCVVSVIDMIGSGKLWISLRSSLESSLNVNKTTEHGKETYLLVIGIDI